MRRLWLFGPIFLLVLSCDFFSPRLARQPGLQYARTPPPPIGALRAASDTILISGVRITLAAELWLNMMPGSTVGEEGDSAVGTPLRGSFTVSSAESQPFPEMLAVEGAWILAGDSIWSIPIVPSDTAAAGSTQLLQQVWGGPDWMGEGSVDLVVRLRPGDGPPILLRAPGVVVSVEE